MASVVPRPACSGKIAECPLASVLFTALPVHRVSKMDSERFRVPLASPPSHASALHCLHLPVWPSTRRFWPPSRSVQHSWGAWHKRICSGKCHRADLQRGRSPGLYKRDASRPRHHTFHRSDARRLKVIAEGLTLFGGCRYCGLAMKSVTQKCCSSQVPLGVVPYVAEHETYNALLVARSGRTKHAEHDGT